MGCIDLPQFQDRLLHGVHRHVPGFGLIFQLPERDDTMLSHTIGTQKRPVPESAQTIPSLKRLLRFSGSLLPIQNALPRISVDLS